MNKILLRTTALVILCTLMLSSFSSVAYATPVVETTPTGIPLEGIEGVVDEFMAEYIGVSSPGAAVAIVKNGEIVFVGTYGLADVENNIPVNENTVFECGSINKLFVWVSVMQLVEQGRLDLDVDIRTYLPDDFNEQWDITYPVTMRNIINHSSGFGEYPFGLMLQEEYTEIDLADIILNAHPAQFFKPGTASVYSNYATAIAAYTVECISGQEFYRYQRESIFDVVGMSQSAGHPYWVDNIDILNDKAQGYAIDAEGNVQNTGWSRIGLYPAGALNATVEDLARFTIALMPEADTASPLFQNVDTINILLSPSYAEGASGTAHGFFQLDSATTVAFGHGGNTISFSSHLVFVPEEQFALIVLTNVGGEQEILFGLQELLIGNGGIGQTTQGQAMPSAYEVVGNYVSMRRAEGTPIEFIHYLSLTNIQAVDENTIQFSMGGISAEYVQTAPYVFEITENSAPILKAMYYRLEFKIENGVPVQIMIGNGQDFSTFPVHRTPLILILSVVVLVISALLFAFAPFALLVTMAKKKKQGVSYVKKSIQLQTALTLCGTGLLINNVILIVLMLTNQLMPYSQVLFFEIVNYVLAAVGTIAIILNIANFKNFTTNKQKATIVFTSVMLTSFVLLLVNWNMFVLYI